MTYIQLALIFLFCFIGIQSAPIQSKGPLCQNLVLSYKACADLAYADENNVAIVISLGGSNLFNGKINVNNPEPICGSKFGAQVCFEFQITPQGADQFNVCVQVKGTYPFLGTSITNLGCSVVSK